MSSSNYNPSRRLSEQIVEVRGEARGQALSGVRPKESVHRRESSEVAEIQRHLLPASLPNIPGYRFAVHYVPCDAAGGDYYGFQHFADGRLGMVIADVAGHGAAAAVMMAVMRSALAAFRVYGRLLEGAAQDVNAIINEVSVPGVFVTAFFVSLDPESGRIFCGNCGHPHPIIRRASGRVDMISGTGDLPLGIAETIDPPMLADRLEVGDSLVLYTDGITEARSEARAFFGEDELVRTVAAADGSDPSALLARIVSDVSGHQRHVMQADDQCVLVCTRTG